MTRSNKLKHEIALSLVKSQKWKEAIKAYEADYLQINQPEKTNLANKYYNQAATEGQKGKLLESANTHCKLLALESNHERGLRNFAVVLRLLGCLGDAKYYITAHIRIAGETTHSLNTLGTIESSLGHHQEAIIAFKKALSIDSTLAEASSNLANEYHINAEIDKAFIYSSKAVFIQPNNATILLDHLTHLKRVCNFNRQLKINWKVVLNSSPVDSIAQSFLMLLTYDEKEGNDSVFFESVKRWGIHQSQRANITNHHSDSHRKQHINPKGGKLKLAFISADLCDHSVARFLWPLVDGLNRDKYTLIGYSTQKSKDNWRERFRSRMEIIHEIGELNSIEMLKRTKDDKIDVLIDLTGFTKGSKLAALAQRLAPVQISWLGFPGTTGLPEMDYLFLDKYLKPLDSDTITEEVMETSQTTICFEKLSDIKITKMLPSDKRGFVTFGSLNNPYKFTPRMIQNWSKAMIACKDSQILFVRREYSSYLLRENIADEFEKHGIERGRLNFLNNREIGRHYLDCYNEIDITLDTYPVTGGTTTIDALWMGVPVISIEGSKIHQRVSSSLLKHAGLSKWVCSNDESFVETAVLLAHDNDYRRRCRHTLRSKLQASALCDTKNFVNGFEKALDKIVRGHNP